MILRPTIRTLTICALAAVAFALGACGDSEDNADLPAAVPANPAETTPTETMTAPATATGKTKSGISTDLSSKPTIPKQSGKEPTKLVVKDIVKGKGKAAKLDDRLTVHYVGSVFSSGEEFEASWDGGETAQFPLSQGQLIDGWVQGIPGMKVGGRRMLVIPSELAYGASGSPPKIGPDEALVFVIDLKKAD
jgi:FKBP-type peptidyl-prolyl cis-trans isomerase